MSSKRWRHSLTSVYNLGYHIIFCPKFRKPILVGDVEKDFRKLMLEKAVDLQVEIVTMEVMPDHVHLFIKTRPTSAPHWLIGQFKGYTSRNLRAKYKFLNTINPCFWTRSYFCESVGSISELTINKYIENQKHK